MKLQILGSKSSNGEAIVRIFGIRFQEAKYTKEKDVKCYKIYNDDDI